MKKIGLLLFLTLLLAFSGSALADTAKDLTPDCRFDVKSKGQTKDRLYDRNWDTYYQGSGKTVQLSITSKEKCYGLYICWTEEPRAWKLESRDSGSWRTVQTFPASHMVHQYYEVDGLKTMRIVPEKGNKDLGIEEIFVLGEGDVPDYVQRWQEPQGRADLLVMFAHPDDDVLYFSGTIPTYAGEMKKNVMAAVLTISTRNRRSELLNDLWHCGLRNYPLFMGFHDKYSSRLEKAYQIYNKKKINEVIVGIYRQFQPKVVLSQDINGEYGHGAHRLMADAAKNCVPLAADASKYPASAEKFGTYEVQKLYLHLARENPIVMDWDKPLSAFGGKTGFEIAEEAYQFHVTQVKHYKQFKVEPKDSPYSSYHFGLVHTTVGPDIQKNDFFENIQ